MGKILRATALIVGRGQFTAKQKLGAATFYLGTFKDANGDFLRGEERDRLFQLLCAENQRKTQASGILMAGSSPRAEGPRLGAIPAKSSDTDRAKIRVAGRGLVAI